MLLTIYLAVGLVCLVLFTAQVRILRKREERESGGRFRHPKDTTLAERIFEVLKATIFFLIPFARTFVTLILLFNEDAQAAVIESFWDKLDFIKNEGNC